MDPSKSRCDASEETRRQIEQSPEYRRVERTQLADQRQKLKEIGGACIWCRCPNVKKACDLQRDCVKCKRDGLPCLRGEEGLWLYGPVSHSVYPPPTGSRRPALQEAKHNTFTSVNLLLNGLAAKLAPSACRGSGVIILRWPASGASHPIVLDSGLWEGNSGLYTLSVNEERQLLQVAQKFTPVVDMDGIDDSAKSGPLLSSALTMLRLVGLLLGIGPAALHVQPGDLPAAQLAVAYFISGAVKTVAKLSGQFSTKLLQELGQKKPNMALLRVATGLYHRILSGLRILEPGSMLTDALRGLKDRVKAITGVLQILQSKYVTRNGQSTGLPPFSAAEEEHFWGSTEIWESTDNPRSPVPLLDAFQLAFHCLGEGSFPVPTALDRQNRPFSVASYLSVSQLLSADPSSDSDSFFAPLLRRIKSTSTDTRRIGESSSSTGGSVPPGQTPMPSSLGWDHADYLDEGLRELGRKANDNELLSVIHGEHPSLRTSQHVTMVRPETDAGTTQASSSNFQDGAAGSVQEEKRFDPSLSCFFDFDSFYEDDPHVPANNKRQKSLVSNCSDQTAHPKAKKPMLDLGI
jgi:hypothetical protein